MRKEKKPKPREHSQLVDDIAGVCLQRLIRGENWRSIIQFAILLTINWVDGERKELNESRKIK